QLTRPNAGGASCVDPGGESGKLRRQAQDVVTADNQHRRPKASAPYHLHLIILIVRQHPLKSQVAPMTARWIFSLGLLLSMAIPSLLALAVAPRQPNIILILADDL
ncbi:MAG: hypothetical protein ACK56I_06480, partial [bacterium]